MLSNKAPIKILLHCESGDLNSGMCCVGCYYTSDNTMTLSACVTHYIHRNRHFQSVINVKTWLQFNIQSDEGVSCVQLRKTHINQYGV